MDGQGGPAVPFVAAPFEAVVKGGGEGGAGAVTEDDLFGWVGGWGALKELICCCCCRCHSIVRKGIECTQVRVKQTQSTRTPPPPSPTHLRRQQPSAWPRPIVALAASAAVPDGRCS